MTIQTANSIYKDYFTLCKPKIVLLIIITAICGMLIPSFEYFNPLKVITAIIGITLLSAGGAVLNNIIDKDNDALMKRTQKRGTAKGTVSIKNAYFFTFTLSVLGFSVLYYFNNLLSALLTLISMIGYGFIYTYYLKYITVQNIVIGGITGSMPPLLGWVAITNSLDPYPFLMVLIIFIWTPSHFWALAIHKKDEYKKLKYPVFPVVYGIKLTTQHIFLYSILLCIVSLLPFLIGKNSFVYLILSLILNYYYLYLSILLLKNYSISIKLFRYSIQYLGILFTVLMLDYYIFNYLI